MCRFGHCIQDDLGYFQDSMKEVEAAVGEIKEAVADLEKEEQELQKDNIEVRHELDRYENIVKENAQKVKHWKKEVNNDRFVEVDM